MKSIIGFASICLLIGNCLNAQEAALVRFYQNAKVGYKDASGKVVVNPDYSAGSEFYNGYALVLKGNKRGYINAKGEVAIDFIYDDASIFTSSGLARVTQNGKSGFINKKGEAVIALSYDFADDFNADGLARVAKDGKYGFINTEGKEIIAITYLNARNFSEGMAAVQTSDKKWGFIDKSGKWVIPAKFDDAILFSQGIARVRTDKRNFYVDKKGMWVKDEESHEEMEEGDREGEKDKGVGRD